MTSLSQKFPPFGRKWELYLFDRDYSDVIENAEIFSKTFLQAEQVELEAEIRNEIRQAGYVSTGCAEVWAEDARWKVLGWKGALSRQGIAIDAREAAEEASEKRLLREHFKRLKEQKRLKDRSELEYRADQISDQIEREIRIAEEEADWHERGKRERAEKERQRKNWLREHEQRQAKELYEKWCRYCTLFGQPKPARFTTQPGWVFFYVVTDQSVCRISMKLGEDMGALFDRWMNWRLDREQK